MLTPDQAGWILGWCYNNESTAHAAGALLSNQFGIEVHCQVIDNGLWIKLFGEDVSEANSVLKFASAIRYEGDLVFERVIVDISRFRDSGPLTEPE